jgi:phosphatidylserine decarboxylase
MALLTNDGKDMKPHSDTNKSNISQKENKYRFYLVAFLDMLGQKDKLLEIKALPQTTEELDVFMRLDKETRVTVMNFRKAFFNFFKGMYKKRPIPPELTEEQRAKYLEIKERAEKLKPSVIPFSDSIIVYVPLSDDDRVIQVDGIFSSMLAIAGAFLVLMINGNIFRGGIEIGIACHIGPNEIYGPALAKAHELESKRAKYPRVVAGDELVDFLQKTSRNLEKEAQSKINQVMAQKCLNLLMIDADGNYALDYLGQEYRDMSKQILPDIYEKALSFLESSFSEIKEKKNGDLFMRYLWLTDYFENRLFIWQKSNQGE